MAGEAFVAAEKQQREAHTTSASHLSPPQGYPGAPSPGPSSSSSPANASQRGRDRARSFLGLGLGSMSPTASDSEASGPGTKRKISFGPLGPAASSGAGGGHSGELARGAFSRLCWACSARSGRCELPRRNRSGRGGTGPLNPLLLSPARGLPGTSGDPRTVAQDDERRQSFPSSGKELRHKSCPGLVQRWRLRFEQSLHDFSHVAAIHVARRLISATTKIAILSLARACRRTITRSWGLAGAAGSEQPVRHGEPVCEHELHGPTRVDT